MPWIEVKKHQEWQRRSHLMQCKENIDFPHRRREQELHQMILERTLNAGFVMTWL